MSVIETKRQNMLHLQAMKPVEFIEFVQNIKSELGGKLQGLKTVMKVDGMAGRFGKDIRGRVFFEGARTGPIFEPNAFSRHAASRGSSQEIIIRAQHYDRLWDEITKSDLIRGLPNNTKIICEVFYNPMAEIDDTGIRFVTIKYDRNKVGTKMSILPFQVVEANTGNQHPKSKEILEYLYKKSTNEIKVIDPQLSMGTIDVNAVIDPLKTLFNDETKRILQSRTNADKPEKARLISVVDSVKEDLSAYLLSHPAITDKFKLGPEIEGIVVWINGREYKITTDAFKQSKAKTCELFLGRMQPIHNGHLAIIQKMKNPVIAIVKGDISSANKDRNPLDAEYQMSLLKKVAPNAKVIVVPGGFLPKLITHIQETLNLRVNKIYAGADRIAGYQKQLSRAPNIGPIEFVETQRVTSATAVRDAIKNGDKATFEKLVPRAIWGEWNTLRGILTEEAESNVTSGVEGYDAPMPKSLVKRKRLEGEALKEHFRELLEKLNVPNQKMGFIDRRGDMPQIRNVVAFQNDLFMSGVFYEYDDNVTPEDLSPTQKEFNEGKVDSIVSAGSWAKKPIFFSNDNYVIDGHHRWLAAHKANSLVPGFKIDMTIDQVLEFLKDKPYIEKAKK